MIIIYLAIISVIFSKNISNDKKYSYIIALFLFLYIKRNNEENFNLLNLNFESSIFRIHAQDIKFNWLEPYKHSASFETIGTGILIDKKGFILTCSHVIHDSIKLFISLPAIGKKTFEAEVYNFNPQVDIAIIKIKNLAKFKKSFKKELEPLSLGDSDKIKLGENVLALGYPLGEDKLKRTSGIISGIQDSSIQTDTPINPGNSGGPLVNKHGKVVGINYAAQDHANNIGYSIPIYQFKRMEKILRNKSKNKVIPSPIIGGFMNNTNKYMIKYLMKNFKCKGYYVSKVFKNGPLNLAGINQGDVICSFNNINIDNFGELKVSWSKEKVHLSNLISRFNVGKKIPISFFSNKDKKIKNTVINLKGLTFYPIRDYYPPFEKIEYLIIGGMILMNLSLNHLKHFNHLSYFNRFDNRLVEKVLLTKILPGSFLKRNKILSSGNIITDINNIPVSNINQCKNAIRKPVVSSGVKYLVIKNYNNKLFVISYDKIIEEEKFLSKNHKYKQNLKL